MKKNLNNHQLIEKIRFYGEIALFIAGLVFLYLGLGIELESYEPLLNYHNEPSIDYKVYLKENTDFQDPYLESDKSYISSLIDEIIPTFNYTLISGTKFDLEYNYQIKTELVAYEISDTEKSNEIFKEEEILLDKVVTLEENQNGYKIKETVALNYETYLNKVKTFEENNEVELNSYLKVYFQTHFNGKKDGDNFIDYDEIFLEIPINDGPIEIKKYNTGDTSEVDGLVTDKLTNNYSVIIGSSLLLVSGVLLFLEYHKLKKLKDAKIDYHKEINNIIKRNKHTMLKTNKLPNLKNRRLIEIANIEDLVELEEEKGGGILVYEKAKQNETWFIIIHESEAWLYIKKVNQN